MSDEITAANISKGLMLAGYSPTDAQTLARETMASIRFARETAEVSL